MICSSIVARKALLVRDPHWRGLVVEVEELDEIRCLSEKPGYFRCSRANHRERVEKENNPRE
jgi:hypothetical protein